MKEHNVGIDILKIIGITFILNSHLDSIYPISQMATGGALGNSLFFICAGFLFQINVGDTFFIWIKNKVINLYLPVYIMTFTLNMIHIRTIHGNFFHEFVWPTHYWLIGAIMLFYLLLYVLTACSGRYFKEITICVFAVMVVLYVFSYIFLLDTSSYVVESAGLDTIQGKFKLIYYFIITLIGKYIREYGVKKKRNEKICFIIVVLSIVLFYCSKFLENRFSFWMHCQFIEQIFVIFFSVSSILYVLIKNSVWTNCISLKEKNIIQKISSLSLYFYLVQFTVIQFCEKRFPFPGNLLMTLLGTFFFAYILERVTSWIKRKSIRIFSA